MYWCIDINRIKQQNYLAHVLHTSSWRAVISILFHFFSSVVSKPKQSWLASSSICSPVSMSAAPSTLFMMAKIILACSFSYWWWIHWTCFPQCSPWVTTSNPLSHIGLGHLRETHSGDKASEVLYLLRWILSCPLTNETATTISCCLKFPCVLYTPPHTPGGVYLEYNQMYIFWIIKLESIQSPCFHSFENGLKSSKPRIQLFTCIKLNQSNQIEVNENS